MTADTVGKPRKDEHTLRLSGYYTDLARKIAAERQMSFGEVITRACERGLVEMQEERKTDLVIRKMERRLGDDSLPDDKDD